MTYQDKSELEAKPGSGENAPSLANRIAQFTQEQNRVDTAIRGLSLHYWTHDTEPTSYMMAPSLCLIGQGRKRLFLGEQSFAYSAKQFLITSVDLPVISQIIEATEEKPYLGLTLEIDLNTIGSMIAERGLPPGKSSSDRSAVIVGDVSAQLLNAIERLLDLLDAPGDIGALAPLYMREIFYRLLASEQGPRLGQMISTDSQSHKISRAIDWLKDHFDEPLKVEELAGRAGLSKSAFHSHFRSVTAMSPLQFQKRMRLNEARRLMLVERLDAASASFAVGYESPTQFSREYSRQFGAPPIKDIRGIMQPSAK